MVIHTLWRSSLAHFVPYSHVLPRPRTLPSLFTEEQHAEFRQLLGGLYTVPSDERLALVFQAFELQKHSYDNAKVIISQFLSFMEILGDFRGSFRIQDFDDSPDGMSLLDIEHEVALYGYKGGVLKGTAQDAEEYFLNISPIRLDKPTRTSPWRRLMQVEPYL
jgi:hypothetical protein